MRRKAAGVAAALAIVLGVLEAANAGEVQVLLPAELTGKLLEGKQQPVQSVVAFEPVQYQIGQEANYFRVEARAPFQVLRAGETTAPLFGLPVHLLESRVECAETNSAGIVSLTNRLGLFVQSTGPGALRLAYRVPIENREGKRRAQVPLLVAAAGNLRLESTGSDFEVLTGSLWNKLKSEKATLYEIGVAGEESLVLEWRDQSGETPAKNIKAGDAAKEFYGIGLSRAQNLTVVNSDGSCTHFAEFEVPALQVEEFRMKMPPKARLISISVNGNELTSPTVEEQTCRLRLPGREAQQTAHRLSFRIAYPPLRLGFMGTTELVLPEVFQTTGTIEWVVALPSGFQSQVVSSGLQIQKSPPDLTRFGDYGRFLKSHSHLYLAKDLAPPGAIGLTLKYRQVVQGIYEAAGE